MTQINLKLLNKSPFVRNDTGEPFESAKRRGRCHGAMYT
jgi:hypothetical protein